MYFIRLFLQRDEPNLDLYESTGLELSDEPSTFKVVNFLIAVVELLLWIFIAQFDDLKLLLVLNALLLVDCVGAVLNIWQKEAVQHYQPNVYASGTLNVEQMQIRNVGILGKIGCIPLLVLPALYLFFS